MKRNIIKTCVLGVGLLTLASCDDPMDELTSLVFDRVFSPVDLEARSISENSADLQWTPSEGAGTYTVEVFADDSLTFEGDPDMTFSGLTANDIPYTITGLVYDTKYSARVMAIDTADVDRNSKWSEVYFRTAAQQIFNEVKEEDVSDRSITMSWPAGEQVTRIVVSDATTGAAVVEHEVTEAEKAAGQATITGLTPETAYRINMYNGDKERGEKTFTTIADLAGAILVREGDDLGALLEAANEGDVFALYGGNHAIGGDTAAAECAVISKSITIKGIYPTKRPRILGRFQLNDGASLTMSQVVVDGANNTSGDQAFNYKTDGVTYGALDVQDCEIKNFTKGLLYLNVAATINTVTFNNCLIHDIVCDGGDFYDCRKGRINETNIMNSTIYNVATGGRDLFRMDDASSAMGGGNPTINLLNCTLNNVSGAGKRLLYLRYAGNVTNWKNNLVTNTEAVFSNQSATTPATFENNSYFNTPNLSSVVEKTNLFTDEGSGVVWDVDPNYADPDNGDFTITNEDVSTRGVGDPRWYTAQ